MSDSGGETRPPIPADIRRRVLVEAGHRCAIPTCRYIDVEIHHIIPWETCRSHEYENLIALCPNCHSRADAGKIDRKSLRLYKLNLRFAHDKFSQLEMDMLFDLARMPRDCGAPWVPYMMIFFKRLLDAGYVFVMQNTGIGITVGGMDTAPALLLITDKGREFVTELGLHEL